MVQVLSIPAVISFKLNNGTVIYPEQFEGMKDRFAFVEWNIIEEMACYLKMMSKRHLPGAIEISEEKEIRLVVNDGGGN